MERGRWTLAFATLLACILLLTPTGPIPVARATPMNLRWGYYVTYDSGSLDSLRQHIGQLDIVAPYFYELRADGSIDDFSNATAMSLMRASGVRIVPMISNAARGDDFHNSLATPQQRDAVVRTLVDLVTRNGYDGIHIDFEAINPADGPLLTDFMQRLAAPLHAQGKLVTQALAARVSDASDSWGGAYDYAALGAVNDYVAVMAYDDHYAGGGPGPVAGVNWVQQVSAYTASRIAPEKVFLGVPFYGYDWDLTTGPPARSVHYDQTSALLAQSGVVKQFDTAAQTHWFRYTDAASHTHEVWYEDVDSLHAKLQVMIDYRFAGFAAWRLGEEDPAVWPEIGHLATPATRIPPFTSTSDRTYFPETGHSLAYGFKSFWEHNGGLPVFGYPQTEEFNEGGYTVQYFERQRFEWHPDLRGTPYEVELGLLGSVEAEQLGISHSPPFQLLPSGTAGGPGCMITPETGHSLCGRFRTYWEGHGLDFGDSGNSFRESLALFGFPISEPFTDPSSGLTVQYFERARFEYHPENAGTQYEILLGLLGNDELRAKDWIR